MNRHFLIQAELEPEIAERFVKLRTQLGMNTKTLLTRILNEAMPRWEQLETTPRKTT